MNDEQIIEMTRQAGGEFYEGFAGSTNFVKFTKDDFEKFAKLVAQHEREACIEIAEKQRYAMHISLTSHPPQNGTAVGIANQIRARGEKV